MQTTHRFHLPDVGEGLTEAEIVRWCVEVGDAVAVDEPLVEIETVKATVELPSPRPGVIVEIHAKVGEVLPVGAPLVSIAGDVRPEAEDDSTEAVQVQPLVGYGPRTNAAKRRRVARTSSTAATDANALRPRAKPPVRRLAMERGVDLSAVTPTGIDGTVTREDVLTVAGVRGVDAQTAVVRRIAISGVRRRTAEAVSRSALGVPHVTEFLTVDVTETLRLRDVLHGRPEFAGTRLTPLAFIAHAYLWALRRNPMATARWDGDAAEIILPETINLGIAVATDRGLIVPNIPNAERLGLQQLATALAELTASARSGATPPSRLVGGTTTITNVGVFGVDTGTPILNPGETAILAIGAIQRRPWVVGDGLGETVQPRPVVQLVLSFDHRVIDGMEGSAVLADTAALLREPGLTVL